jgi:glycine C-acetyltransferase
VRSFDDGGVFANLIEYPAVPVGGARLRMQVMATHTLDHAREAAVRVIRAREMAKIELSIWEERA